MDDLMNLYKMISLRVAYYYIYKIYPYNYLHPLINSYLSYQYSYYIHIDSSSIIHAYLFLHSI